MVSVRHPYYVTGLKPQRPQVLRLSHVDLAPHIISATKETIADEGIRENNWLT